MFAVLSCASPQYLEILYTTSSGRLLLAVGGVMLLTGAWLMNRMAILRY
jgi:Flp pilus assembly protein TadB